MITSTRTFFFPVVTLSMNHKQVFKVISWNKCRFEIKKQSKNNNFGYTIDWTFWNINILFFQLFKAGENESTKSILIRITCH